MKKAFSKLISVMLVAIMILSLVQLPAFAAVPVYRDPAANQNKPGTTSRQHRSWIAPYGDEVSHFDYYADGGDMTVQYYTFSPTEAISIDPDGILVMNSKFGDPNENHGTRVVATTDNGATGAHSGNINWFENSPYIFNFDDPFCYSSGGASVHAGADDTTTAVITNASVATDSVTGNKYLVSDYSYSNKNAISLPQNWLRPKSYPNEGAMNSFIISADVLLKSDEDFSFGIRYGTADRIKNYLKWNHSTKVVTDNAGRTIASVEPGWHKIKIMLNGNIKTADNPNPYRYTSQMYTLFFDDELLTPTSENIYDSQTYIKPTATNSGRPDNLFQFMGMGGLDNFKLYGSSTPHPYGVGLEAAPQSGAVVSGSASMACVVDYTNDKTHFEYSYYVSDTTDKNGTYTKVTSADVTSSLYVTREGKLALNGDFTGRHIKVGARVWNRGGLSPEIMSKEIYTVSGYADGSGLGPEPDDGEDPETPKDLEPYIIYMAENHTSDTRLGTYHGKTAIKWGPGEAELKKGMGTSAFNAATDRYKYLVIEMYSAKKTHHPMNVLFYKSGYEGKNYYYVQSFNVNWEGGWNKIKLPVSGGLYDSGNCNGRNNPPWKPYEATTINLSAALHESSRFYPDTELYVSKMYFEGNGEGQTVANSKGEIILADHYDPSWMTDYASVVKQMHPDKHHPRLIVTEDRINAIKNNLDSNEFLKKVYDKIKEVADSMTGLEPEPPYTVTNGKATYNRNYFEKVAKYCGLMYLLTGEDKYAEQVWKEAANMIDVEVLWSAESTGLDAGHISNGMALTYDWCYDWLSDSQKLAIRNALMKNTYDDALDIRNGGGYMGYRNNVVAANSKGFVTSALAICDEPGYEDLCNEIINLVVKHLPENIGHQFVPDGNYAEGIGYWSYATYSMMFMSDAMLTAMGTDCGIQDMPGLDKTGYFVFAMRGSFSLFNFSDAGKNVHQNMSPVFHYLAKRYDIPALRSYRIYLVNKYFESTGPSIEDLLWYDTSLPNDDDWRSKMPKDYFIDGLVPLVSMRSGTGDKELYIAAKGGNGRIGHIQYDGGTFVLDALGIEYSATDIRGKRWIHDMGAETYQRTRDGKYYYCMRTEGHNCIVFDPESESMGQTIAQNEYDTYCPIVDSGASENEAFSVINLQPSYQEYVNSYERGYAILNNRSQFIVQDKFSRKEAGELYSYLHIAESDIIVGSDSHSITLKQKSAWNYLRIEFITDIPDFEIGVTEAIHHLESLRPDPNETDVNTTGHDCTADYNKIYFHADNVKDATITMVFTPFTEEMSLATPDIKPMDKWDEYLGDDSYANYSEVIVNSVEGNKVNISSSWILTGKNKTIILAAYKNNVLKDVKSVKANIYRVCEDYTVPGFDPKDYDTVKAFVWDDMKNTLVPVSKEFEIKKQ